MRILWIGDSERAAVLRQDGEEFEVATAAPGEVSRAMLGGGIDVIVADGWSTAAREAAPGRPTSVQMVAVLPGGDTEAIRDAVRAGVDDVVFTTAELPHALRTLPGPRRSGIAAARPQFEGRVLAVVGPHGGAGRTTLAVNLALVLAGSQPVILWDCVPYFGNAHIALGLDPTTGLEVLEAADETDLTARLVVPYEDIPLRLLPGPHSPDAEATYSAPVVLSVLARLRGLAPWVVVDTDRVLSSGLVPVVDRADAILVVGRLGVAQARALRGYLDTVVRGYGERLVLCATGSPRRPLWASRGVTPGALHEFAGISVEHVLPFDHAVLSGDDTGQPAVLAAPRGPYARAVAALGARIAERFQLAQERDVVTGAAPQSVLV